MSNQKNLSVRSSTEVMPRAKRRRFSVEKKHRILKEYEACAAPGEKGALLRREGFQVSVWRTQRDTGKLAAGRRRPYADVVQENAQLKEELRKARWVIEVQKKISDAFGIANLSADKPAR